MNHVNLPRTKVALLVSALLLWAGRDHGAQAQPPGINLPPVGDWIVSSDAWSNPQNLAGCDRISVYDINHTDRSILAGGWAQTPAHLAATSDGALIVSNMINGPKIVHAITRLARADGSWRPVAMAGNLEWKSAIYITRDDQDLILPYSTGLGRQPVTDVYSGTIGSDMFRPGNLAEPRQLIPGINPIAMVDSLDAKTLYVAAIDGKLHRIDMKTFQVIAPALDYPVTDGGIQNRATRTYMSISPDGRFLVINGGPKPRLSVVDIAAWSLKTVALKGLTTNWGVSFNYTPGSDQILAVHGKSRLGIYRFLGAQAPTLLATASIAAYTGGSSNFPDYFYMAPDIVWSGSGDRVVAASGAIRSLAIFRFSAGPPARLQSEGGIQGCSDTRPGWEPHPQDILSFNRPELIRPTPTITLTPLPSETPLPTASATPTASSPPTARSTPTALPSPTLPASPTTTPRPTVTPRPQAVYLPLLLRESCTPEQRRIDVALVLDASQSMLEPAASGSPQTKLEAARDAARAFLDALRLDQGDQAAIVSFNSRAILLTGLTADRPALDAAVAAITPSPQTCIVCGLDTGAQELAGPRRQSGNLPVLILLTDGRSNPQPASEAVTRAGAAKAAGIRLYTIGLGADLDEAALREMSSGDGAYFHAPSGTALAGIYREIAVDIPCPPGAFWGGR